MKKIKSLLSIALIIVLCGFFDTWSQAGEAVAINLSPLPDRISENFDYPSCWFSTKSDPKTLDGDKLIIFIRGGEQQREDVAVINLNGEIVELPYVRGKRINSDSDLSVYQKLPYTLHATIIFDAPTGEPECNPTCVESSGVSGKFKLTVEKVSKIYKFTGACGI
ncbi:MAG TPA: hypothetical protein VIE65_03955 [Methylobacter sp.]|jgi:hypothetical protein